MVWWLIGGVLLLVVWVGLLHPMLQTRRLSQTVLLPGSFRIVAAHELPPSASEPLIAAQKFLLSMGFKPQCHLLRGPTALGQSWGVAGVLMYLPKMNTWAHAYVEPVSDGVQPWKLTFLTPLEEQVLVTDVGNSLRFPENHKVVIQNQANAFLPSEQWISHREFLRDHRGKKLNSLPIFAVLQKIEYIGFAALSELGQLRKARQGLHLSYRYAKSLTKSVQKKLIELAAQKQKNPQKARAEYGDYDQAARTRIDLAAYQALHAVDSERQEAWLNKTLILLVSVALFALAFGVVFTWQTVLVLIAVLFIHELGHLFGMWLFGYRNLQIFFIPFFGAAASGRNDNSSAMQEAIVLLLGPLPGYILGLALLFSFDVSIESWLGEFAVFAIILNLLNLLPFHPLDGGRLISLALFSIYPRLQLVFIVFSMLAFALAAYVIGEPVFYLLAFILLSSFWSSKQQADFNAHLLKRDAKTFAHDPPRLMYALQAHPAWDKLPPPEKFQLFTQLKDSLRHARAGLGKRVFILLLWGAAIIAPPIIFGPPWLTAAVASLGGYYDHLSGNVLITQFEESEQVNERANLAASIASLKSLTDEEAAQEWWAKSLQLTEQIEDVDQLANMHLTLSSVCSELEDEQCESDRLRIARSVSQRASTETQIRVLIASSEQQELALDTQLDYLSQARIAAADDAIPSYTRVDIEMRLAELHEQHSQPAKAEQALQRALTMESDENDGYVVVLLLDFYYRQNRFSAANQLLDQYPELATKLSDDIEDIAYQLPYQALWFYAQTDLDKAEKQLQDLLSQKPEHLELLVAEQLLRSLQNQTVDTRRLAAVMQSMNMDEDTDTLYLIGNLAYFGRSNDEEFGNSYTLQTLWYSQMLALLQTDTYKTVYEKMDIDTYL